MPLISMYVTFDASSLGARYTRFVLAWAWKEMEAWLVAEFPEVDDGTDVVSIARKLCFFALYIAKMASVVCEP